jgi:hypothetical protein
MQQQLLLTAMALLLAGAALVLSFPYWKGLLYQKARGVDPQIEREFNRVFTMTSKEGKEALIKRWTDKKQCGRGEAMRLAVEEWRRDNR